MVPSLHQVNRAPLDYPILNHLYHMRHLMLELSKEGGELMKSDISLKRIVDVRPFFLEKNILYYMDVDWPRKYTQKNKEVKQTKHRQAKGCQCLAIHMHIQTHCKRN